MVYYLIASLFGIRPITASCFIYVILFIIINYILACFSQTNVCEYLQTVQQDADVHFCVTAHHLWCLVSSYTSWDRTLPAALSLSVITGVMRLLVRDTLAHIF